MVVGVVLGAGVLKQGVPKRAIIRVNKAVRLWKKGIVSQLVVCGGYTNPAVSLSEAFVMKRILVDRGVPARSVLLESKSRNTYENALFSSRLVKSKDILLITDGWHRRRALALFKKAFSKKTRIACA
ncbi:YdcF family protein [Candidatus Woesearchaeota archaeon]|nr:YdcF family protein [Candidatus Woesearchaeota archaeon]